MSHHVRKQFYKSSYSVCVVRKWSVIRFTFIPSSVHTVPSIIPACVSLSHICFAASSPVFASLLLIFQTSGMKHLKCLEKQLEVSQDQLACQLSTSCQQACPHLQSLDHSLGTTARWGTERACFVQGEGAVSSNRSLCCLCRFAAV